MGGCGLLLSVWCSCFYELFAGSYKSLEVKDVV